MVLRKEADVLGQHMEIGMRHPVVREIGDIVPDIQAVALLSPVDQVIPEGLGIVLSRGIRVIHGAFRERMQETALYGAQAYAHIPAGVHMPGRAPRILIGEGVDDDVRKLLFHFLGHRVDKVQKRA